MNKIMKIMKSTLAIHAAVPAIVPKPKTAAMIAIIRNNIAQFSWPSLFMIFSK